MLNVDYIYTMRDFSFVIQSALNATKPELWTHITQMRNVNAELMPYARMTYPADMAEIAGRKVPVNTVLFRSLILLFGFIPVDLHYLRLERIDDGNAFYENSYSLQHYYWKHTRTLTEQNGNTVVRDELHFAPRISFTGYLLLPVYKMIFGNRHKQLQKHFA